MARFYFDIDDGEHAFHDLDGIELENLAEVRNEATGLLPDIARDALPNGNNRVFAVQVRDDANKVIFRATLTLSAGWIES